MLIATNSNGSQRNTVGLFSRRLMLTGSVALTIGGCADKPTAPLVDAKHLARADATSCTPSFNPTETFAANTAPNTSNNSFPGWTNGNAKPQNTSEVDIHQALYAGATTTVYAHFMAWFKEDGGGSHKDVGYNSDDPDQILSQIQSMVKRGVDGVIIDWYGQGSFEDVVSDTLKRVVATYNASHSPDFRYSMTFDGGTLKKSGCSTTSGCTQVLKNAIGYLNTKYFPDPAYARWSSRPLLTFFSVEGYPIDWTSARSWADTHGNPVFIFRNSGAFTHTQTNGGFAWLATQSRTASDTGTYWAEGYLDNFYTTAQSHPSLLAIGSMYKGFDDAMASWGSNRYISQMKGETWVNTINKIGEYYSSAKQLPILQLVTWNDYEEGTTLETGIDNFFSFTGQGMSTVTPDLLKWSVSGNEATLQHYKIFATKDGTNLHVVGYASPGTHQFDMTCELPTGFTYKLYIKAIGKPFVFNHMSGGVWYTP